MLRVKLGWAVTTSDDPDQDFVVVYRWLDLPFAPFEGLCLRNLFPGQVEPVLVIPFHEQGFVWDLRQNCFLCELEGEDFPDVSLSELLGRLGPEWKVAVNWPDDEPLTSD